MRIILLYSWRTRTRTPEDSDQPLLVQVNTVHKQNVLGQKTLIQNVPQTSDKMSHRQSVPREKRSQRTKRPNDQMPQGTKRPKEQNITWNKTSHGKNVPWYRSSHGTNKAHYLTCVTYYLLPNRIRPR